MINQFPAGGRDHLKGGHLPRPRSLIAITELDQQEGRDDHSRFVDGPAENLHLQTLFAGLGFAGRVEAHIHVYRRDELRRVCIGANYRDIEPRPIPIPIIGRKTSSAAFI